MFIIPGFLISGGDPYSSLNKVELYNPATGNSCRVQDLQQRRDSHSSCGGLLCGSWWSTSTYQSCERITGTEVSPLPSLTLTEKRAVHLCWKLPGDKILLLGGYYSPTTTEIISGTSSFASFQLAYNTRQVLVSLLVIIITNITLQVCLWYRGG